MNDILNEVYESMIDTILKDFNADEYEEICQGYKNYLASIYQKSMDLSTDKEKMKKLFINFEKIKWENESKIMKQVMLIDDKSFIELQRISAVALNYATLRLRGREEEIDITEEKAKEYIKKMNECAAQVREFNKENAVLELSEATLDFKYAIGLEENTSLRVGRLR